MELNFHTLIEIDHQLGKKKLIQRCGKTFVRKFFRQIENFTNFMICIVPDNKTDHNINLHPQ